jgi:competence protein ComFC
VYAGVLSKVRDGLLGLAYPSDCRVCGAPVESWDDGVVCASCWCDPALTPLFGEPECLKCGLPKSNEMSAERTTLDCPGCRSLPFAAARACGAYAGGLEASIVSLKTQPHICSRLSSIICEAFDRHRDVLSCDAIVPLPLHPARKRERGFNQADLIASRLSREFSIQLDRRSLLRTRYTERHRAGFDLLDRRKSLLGAFSVAGELPSGKSILLVDDLFTTGSTVGAATATLLQAGATSVKIFTVARVVKRSWT